MQQLINLFMLLKSFIRIGIVNHVNPSLTPYRIICSNADQNLTADQISFWTKYLQMMRKSELKSRSISFKLLQYLIVFHSY